MLFVFGCEDSGHPALGRLEGTIKLDGQPVKGVIVTVTPQGAAHSQGFADDNGHYVMYYKNGVEGVVVGTHNIRLQFADIPIPNEADLTPDQWNEANAKRSKENPIPMKYRDGSMNIQIKPGSNKMDFDVQSEKPAAK